MAEFVQEHLRPYGSECQFIGNSILRYVCIRIMSDAHIVESADPSEAFAAPSDDTRVQILQALWEADNHELSFSELREAVGVRDSGQFNYHLGKLTEKFAVKGDDGYELTVAGANVVGALLAGAYTKEGNVETMPLDDPCPFCGGDRTFSYEDETVRFDCEGCEAGIYYGIAPGVFAEYDAEAFPVVADRYLRAEIAEVRNGFCPHCEGRVQPRVATAVATSDPSADPPERFRDLPTARYDCKRCGEEFAIDLGTALLDEPLVVAFYHDHGVDVREPPLTRFVADKDRTDILERHPIRANVSYVAGGARLTLTVDSSLDVVGVERVDG